MKDLINTIFKTSEERIKNPIIGSFILSWIAVNWNPILFFFFSKADIESKIAYFKDHSGFWVTIGFPLLISFGYVLLLPYLSLGIDFLLRKAQRNKANAILDIKLQSQTNESKLTLRAIELEDQRNKLLQKSNDNNAIENLKLEVNNAKKELEEERESNLEKISKLNSEHADRYKILQDKLEQIENLYSIAIDERNRANQENNENELELNRRGDELNQINLLWMQDQAKFNQKEESYNSLNKEFHELIESYNARNEEMNEAEEKINALEKESIVNNLELKRLNDLLNKTNTMTLHSFDNDKKILEFVDYKLKKNYYNINTESLIWPAQFNDLISNNLFYTKDVINF